MKFKFLNTLIAVLLLTVSSLANAGLIFDSANGVNTESGATNGSTTTGFYTSISVFSDTTINMIEQLTYAGSVANIQFSIFDFDSLALLWSGNSFSAGADLGGSSFANATYKSSELFSFTLLTATKYAIGASTDGAWTYFGEELTTSMNGITSLAANKNTTGFNNPVLLSGAYCCDSYIRLHQVSVDVPEPSTFAIFALGMIGLASRRFKKQ